MPLSSGGISFQQNQAISRQSTNNNQNLNIQSVNQAPIQGDEMSGADEDDFLRESENSSHSAVSQSDRGPSSYNSSIRNQGLAPDRIDRGAIGFSPFIPSYKLDQKERAKFFTENKTSIIDYPKGVPEIEKYLVTMEEEVTHTKMIISHYKEISDIITNVNGYIKKESLSNEPYKGNILCVIQEGLDAMSPIQKQYHDGGKYYGTFKRGLRHGFGKYYFTNGDIYEGMWTDNQRHGEGIYYYSNGEVYRGNYNQGQRDGFGIFNYKNGDRYEGQWKNGNIDGYGIYHYSIGEMYMGQYRENKRCGVGRYTYKNGIIYHGNWENGNQRGVGCYIYGNGVYMGECDLGFRHGKGVYLFKDGSIYEGAWNKGKREGWGIYKYANGSKYTGEHRAGQREGAGMYEYFNKEVYKGNWKKDKKNGYGITILGTGKVQLQLGDGIKLNLPAKELMNFIPDKRGIANMILDRLGSDNDDSNENQEEQKRPGGMGQNNYNQQQQYQNQQQQQYNQQQQQNRNLQQAQRNNQGMNPHHSFDSSNQSMTSFKYEQQLNNYNPRKNENYNRPMQLNQQRQFMPPLHGMPKIKPSRLDDSDDDDGVDQPFIQQSKAPLINQEKQQYQNQQFENRQYQQDNGNQEPNQPQNQNHNQPPRSTLIEGMRNRVTNFYQIAHYGGYFDVNTAEVLFRLRRAIWPFCCRQKPFLDNEKCDLYGPIWIMITLIVEIAIFGFISYQIELEYMIYEIKHGVKPPVSYMNIYSLEKVGKVAFVMSAYFVCNPIMIWLLSKYVTWIQGIRFFYIFCIYGYSFTIFILVMFLSIIPINYLQWATLGYAGFISLSFISIEMYDLIKHDLKQQGSKFFIIALWLIGSHGVFILSLKLYFLTS